MDPKKSRYEVAFEKVSPTVPALPARGRVAAWVIQFWHKSAEEIAEAHHKWMEGRTSKQASIRGLALEGCFVVFRNPLFDGFPDSRLFIEYEDQWTLVFDFAADLSRELGAVIQVDELTPYPLILLGLPREPDGTQASIEEVRSLLGAQPCEVLPMLACDGTLVRDTEAWLEADGKVPTKRPGAFVRLPQELGQYEVEELVERLASLKQSRISACHCAHGPWVTDEGKEVAAVYSLVTYKLR